MVFSRPSNVPYPHVWHRFTVTKQSTTLQLRVQDLTEDMFASALNIIAKYFFRDEPPCKYIGIENYPNTQACLRKLWRDGLNEKMSLICVEDRDDDKIEIVGLNILTVMCKTDKDDPFQTDDDIWAMLFGAVDFVSRSVDIYSRYNVDKYLNAYGLVVVPEWRGMNIGKEILKARIPFCKALDIMVTATVFTAAASQAVAKKAGFIDLFEITYEELAKKGFIFPDIEKDTKSSKLMALTIE